MTRYYFINPAVKPQTEMSSQIELAISKSMETAFVSTMRDTAKQLSEKFGFSYEEALKALEIDSSKSSTMVTLVKPSKKSKEIDDEPVTSRELKFPLPFSGRIVDDCCLAVLNNSGLFSQCLNAPSSKSDQNLCSKCDKQSKSSPDRRPPYGFIAERIEQGDEYVDPKKGSRPVHFTKVMKKLKLTREMIETEVSRLEIFFDTEHFVEPDSKRGRPKKNEDTPVLVKSKKASKNITVETHEDISSLSGDMSSLSGSEEEDTESKKAAKKAQKEAELAEKEQKKAARKLKEQADELEKEQKKVEKEAARKLKEQADELEKEAARKLKEARDLEKEMQKKAQKEAEDAAKEALKQAKDAARKIKEAAEASKKEAKETRMMGGEDAFSKKAEKFIKKTAKEELAKESKPEKKEKPVKESKPAKEQKPTKEEKKPAAKKAKEPEPVQEPVQELEEEEEDEEPTYELAIAPKGQTDLKIQGVTYIYQNGNVFDKKTNVFVGTYDWKTKVFEMAEDDDEIDQEEEEIPPIEEDEEEEEVVASQSDAEEEED
jgi:hypothetical protein